MANNLSIFDISGRAMSAQLVRLNTTASNLANAGTVSGSEGRRLPRDEAGVPHDHGRGRARRPSRSTASTAPPTAPVKRHEPAHPLADANGNVWEAAVDSAAEMVEMIETSRHYQNNVQVLATAKGLISETLRLGQ